MVESQSHSYLKEFIIQVLSSKPFVVNGEITTQGICFYVFLICVVFISFLAFVACIWRVGSFVFRFYPGRLDEVSRQNVERAEKKGATVIEDFGYSWIQGVQIKFQVIHDPKIITDLKNKVAQLEEKGSRLEERISQLEGELAQKKMNGG